jgi:hypothetical protein
MILISLFPSRSISLTGRVIGAHDEASGRAKKIQKPTEIDNFP